MANVLVVDDHPDMREILSQLLTMQGHSVQVCDSGEEALRQLDDELPDALIVDDRMPGISGLDLLSQIRADSRLAKLFVVICSADSLAEPRARAAGADDFWIKGSESIFDSVTNLAAKLN